MCGERLIETRIDSPIYRKIFFFILSLRLWHGTAIAFEAVYRSPRTFVARHFHTSFPDSNVSFFIEDAIVITRNQSAVMRAH